MLPLVRLAVHSSVGKKCADRDLFVVDSVQRVGQNLWWKGWEIRTLDDHMTLALNGEGHLEDEELDLDNAPQLVGEEHEDGNELAREYEIGPQGRTKFDEYYEARKAKNKKRKESRCKRE